jgi:hypothetical protein
MKIMTTNTSATTREDTPHVLETSRTNSIINALKRRAQAVLNDRSIDPQTRAIIRYGLEINDPWLAELVRRADSGERISETFDFSQTPETNEQTLEEDKLNTLADIICRSCDSSAALLVLMATLENSTHPRLLANAAKHVAFTRCGDSNLYRMLGVHIAQLEDEMCVS